MEVCLLYFLLFPFCWFYNFDLDGTMNWALGRYEWPYQFNIPNRVKEWMVFLGRNSLIVYVYSPLFTNPCTKYLSSVLAFDSTRILFLVIALPLSILGTILVGKILDTLRISHLLIGRRMQ